MSGIPPHDLLIGDGWEQGGEIIDTYDCGECGATYTSKMARDACCQD